MGEDHKTNSECADSPIPRSDSEDDRSFLKRLASVGAISEVRKAIMAATDDSYLEPTADITRDTRRNYNPHRGEGFGGE